jgi:hypothetical protein
MSNRSRRHHSPPGGAYIIPGLIEMRAKDAIEVAAG